MQVHLIPPPPALPPTQSLKGHLKVAQVVVMEGDGSRKDGVSYQLKLDRALE